MIDYNFLSHILNPDQKILHLKDDNENPFDQYCQYKKYITAGSNNSDVTLNDVYKDNLLNYLDFFPDLLLFGEILERTNDPCGLIKAHKSSADQIVIYEFKYTEIKEVPKDWKKPWESIGLASFLYKEFDWVNEVFLDGVTVYTCKEPSDNTRNKKID